MWVNLFLLCYLVLAHDVAFDRRVVGLGRGLAVAFAGEFVEEDFHAGFVSEKGRVLQLKMEVGFG